MGRSGSHSLTAELSMLLTIVQDVYRVSRKMSTLHQNPMGTQLPDSLCSLFHTLEIGHRLAGKDRCLVKIGSDDGRQRKEYVREGSHTIRVK
jgi:hypothetical protein